MRDAFAVFSGDLDACSSDIACWKGSGRRPGLRPLGLSGREGARSCAGRGEMGMFHKLASSGNSSSESWYSSSNSFSDFRLGCHVCLLTGTRAESGDKAKLVLEAERLEVGRSGDTDRDRRGWEGANPGDCSVLPESLRFPDFAIREPDDFGGFAPLNGGKGLRFRGFEVAVKSRVEVVGPLLDIRAAGDRAIAPARPYEPTDSI